MDEKNKSIWQGKVMGTPYIDITCDENYLKTNWLDTKTEYGVMIKLSHCNTQKIDCQLPPKIILVDLLRKNLCTTSQ